jgi:hypothetical protein
MTDCTHACCCVTGSYKVSVSVLIDSLHRVAPVKMRMKCKKGQDTGTCSPEARLGEMKLVNINYMEFYSIPASTPNVQNCPLPHFPKKTYLIVPSALLLKFKVSVIRTEI